PYQSARMPLGGGTATVRGAGATKGAAVVLVVVLVVVDEVLVVGGNVVVVAAPLGPLAVGAAAASSPSEDEHAASTAASRMQTPRWVTRRPGITIPVCPTDRCAAGRSRAFIDHGTDHLMSTAVTSQRA